MALTHKPTFKPTTPSQQMQERTRRERGFHQVERDLPDFSGRSTPTVMSTKLAFYRALSCLGSKNPLPRPVTAQDTVWLLDNAAYRNDKTGLWEAEYVAALFSQHSSCSIADVVASIAKEIHLGERDPAYKTIEERVWPFVQDVKPGAQVRVLYDRKLTMMLGPSGRNGTTSNIERLPGGDSGDLVSSFASVPEGANGVLEMRTFYAETEGWGVISDVDDTIKITQTSDPIGILRTTFIDEPQPVSGMPELYGYLHSLIGNGSSWFYLSASPYNLYPFLRNFRQQYYPHGTLILRDVTWMNIAGLLANLTTGTEVYKTNRMEKIHSWLPKRKMICVGDSTQTDPEAYGEIYRRYPQWVKAIFIRKVEDIAAIGSKEKNDPERFEAAFKGVPRDVWHVFTQPDTCRQLAVSSSRLGLRCLSTRGIRTGIVHYQIVPTFGFANVNKTYTYRPVRLLTSTMPVSTRQSSGKSGKSGKAVPYNLIYWPGIPGRGEFVRLALEEGGAEYTDTAREETGINEVLAQIKGDNIGDEHSPPPFAPPILRHGDLLISQTPNILLYLGPKLGLVPEVADAQYHVNALALTVLDRLCDEPHDCHHPIASGLYYEDQKVEALRYSLDFVTNRLPKILGYFERVLAGKASGDGPWLYGGQLTYADLVLFQALDGVKFAFRKAMAEAEASGKYTRVFGLYEAVKERPRIKAYLESERRQEYSQGIYRYYAELDVTADGK
ncbi:hypothetical protein GGR50DRAFT_687909 [Xylaria sp. CBS 124048]|nr:hypothetical protein GGR50DRAFT_687909 [Xylaria sp. CBS 124048]